VVQNLKDVLSARNYMLLTAFKNSLILTVVSVAILVVLCAMVGFVLQRRPGPLASLVNLLVLAGLIIPPAVVPTIWVLQSLGLFKTLPGLILVEVAFNMSFCVLLFRAFVATIPRELDEAAIIDGCSGFSLFFRVIMPLLRPVTCAAKGNRAMIRGMSSAPDSSFGHQGSGSPARGIGRTPTLLSLPETARITGPAVS